MKKCSIKTVDGNRYDFIREKNESLFVTDRDWIVIQDNNITRMFLRENIVSVTIKVEEEA